MPVVAMPPHSLRDQQEQTVVRSGRISVKGIPRAEIERDLVLPHIHVAERTWTGALPRGHDSRRRNRVDRHRETRPFRVLIVVGVDPFRIASHLRDEVRNVFEQRHNELIRIEGVRFGRLLGMWCLTRKLLLLTPMMSVAFCQSREADGIRLTEATFSRQAFIRFAQGSTMLPVSGPGDFESGGTNYVKGLIQKAPEKSRFLWVKLGISNAEKQPLSLNLLSARALDGSGKRYEVAGLTVCDGTSFMLQTVIAIPESPILSTHSTSTTTGATKCSFDLSNTGDNPHATIKVASSASAELSLVFIVPDRDGVFQIEGLSKAALKTPNVTLGGGK